MEISVHRIYGEILKLKNTEVIYNSSLLGESKISHIRVRPLYKCFATI